MTSRERVMAAVNHKQPDRTPCDYLSTPEVDQKMMEYFHTDEMDIVLEHLGIDIRVVNPEYCGPELKKWPDGRFQNPWGQIRKPIKNEVGTYLESVEFPYAEFKSVKDVENFNWPKLEWFDFSSVPDARNRYPKHAIVYGFPGIMDLINQTAAGRGLEQVMFDIATEDPVGLACMDKRFQCCYEMSEKALEMADGQIDILWIGDDYGSQNGLLISPKTWRKLFYPRLKSMCDLGHNYGAKVMLHSCGSTKLIWPDIIEAGIDIYDTVQPEAADMDAVKLKEEFGEQICFHGTISTQNTLPFGSVSDVKKEVRKRIDTVGVNGGFILAPAHNFQPDTPIENILAIYEEVGSYTEMLSSNKM